MTMRAIAGARILSASGWLDDFALLHRRGVITDLVPVSALPPGAAVDWLDGGVLLPGFVDTQVNGGGGVLFNADPSVAGIAAIAAAHRRFGTTSLLPTLISDDLAVVAAGIAAVDAAIAANVPGVVGIHIEGPFLNPGKTGIHDASKIRTLDDAAVALLSSLRGGKTVVTLAPELAPRGAIAALVRAGVKVAVGHSLADEPAMRAAIAEGMTGVTHLFNAMSQLTVRQPGVVGTALDSDLIAGIIADGHHVSGAALRIALRCRGAAGLMLVTDAMPPVGTDARDFTLNGQRITVRGGRVTAADGTLAGSALDMAGAVRGAMALMDVDLATASQMASRTPTRWLGLGSRMGAIARGLRADLVHLDNQLCPTTTWIGGETGECMAA